MTDLSQWGTQASGHFVLDKQITKLLYYYLFHTWKYFIVYFDGIDIKSYWKYLFVVDSTGRNFIQLPRVTYNDFT